MSGSRGEMARGDATTHSLRTTPDRGIGPIEIEEEAMDRYVADQLISGGASEDAAVLDRLTADANQVANRLVT